MKHVNYGKINCDRYLAESMSQHVLKRNTKIWISLLRNMAI